MMKRKSILTAVIITLTFSLLTLISWNKDAWTEVISQDGVKVSSMTERSVKDGVTLEFVILKIENQTANKVAVSWYLKSWYNETCRSCDLNRPNEYDKKIILAPGETRIGFSKDGPEQLRIFSGFPEKPGHSKLTRFELSDFRVLTE